MSKIALAVLTFLLVVVGGSAPAASAGHAAGPIVVIPSAVKWMPGTGPVPPTVGVAVLEGDPSKSGEYTIRLKMPDGAKFRPHWHDNQERVTVISGTLLVGIGSTFNASKMIALPAGSYGSIPAGLRHYAMAKGDTVIQINGEGPRSMTYLK